MDPLVWGFKVHVPQDALVGKGARHEVSITTRYLEADLPKGMQAVMRPFSSQFELSRHKLAQEAFS